MEEVRKSVRDYYDISILIHLLTYTLQVRVEQKNKRAGVRSSGKEKLGQEGREIGREGREMSKPVHKR
jgi:hypothetical protein